MATTTTRREERRNESSPRETENNPSMTFGGRPALETTPRPKSENFDRNEPSTNKSAEQGFGRPNVQSNPRTVTTKDERNTAGAYTPTFSPTGARGVGTSDSGPSEDEIRRRAYEIYQSRGGEPGREMEDWVQAERELRAKRRATK